MLLFSTTLPINDTLTKDAFIALVIEWNQGSPHPNNVIAGIDWHGERNIRYGNDHLWMEIEEYRNQNVIAIRYEKIEADGVIWDTDYVMNFNAMKMSIRLDRSFMEEALTVDPNFSTPHFITLLINHGYLKNDGDLPVQRQPVLIDENNIEKLSNIINGSIRYRLPVVYISKTFDNKDPIDVWFLASKLKGAAHVLVQKGTWLNSRLRRLCEDKNEYLGAIGIYYPNPAVAHKKLLYREYTGSQQVLFEKVVRTVIQYGNSQNVDSLYTWQGVSNALLTDRLENQRAERLAAEKAKQQTEAETDQLLETFDDDFQKLQEQVKELTRVNEALRQENDGLHAKLSATDSVPILCLGDEDEFYQGEIKDMVLSILCDALPGLVEKSRRADVIHDIINSNEYQHLSEHRAETIKRLLRDYTGMPSRLRQDLTDFGFVITDDGKHYKLTYYGDGRYQTIFAKTPSDGRAGKNNAAAIIKSML